MYKFRGNRCKKSLYIREESYFERPPFLDKPPSTIRFYMLEKKSNTTRASILMDCFIYNVRFTLRYTCQSYFFMTYAQRAMVSRPHIYIKMAKIVTIPLFCMYIV